MDAYFKSLKKMCQCQGGLNELTQRLKEQMNKPGGRIPKEGGQEMKGQEGLPKEGEGNREGENGTSQGLSEQMRKMARHQQSIRKQLEQLNRQYGHLKKATGSLGGIGDMMEQVEKDLEKGSITNRVTQIQDKIEQRLLDAEKSLHTKGFRKKRRALRAIGEPIEGEGVSESAPLDDKQLAELARLLRGGLEEVSPHWRDRVRNYYDSLLHINP